MVPPRSAPKSPQPLEQLGYKCSTVWCLNCVRRQQSHLTIRKYTVRTHDLQVARSCLNTSFQKWDLGPKELSRQLKSWAGFLEDQGSVLSTHMRTTVQGNLMPPSGFRRHYNMWYTDIVQANTHAHKIKTNTAVVGTGLKSQPLGGRGSWISIKVPLGSIASPRIARDTQ